MATNEEIYNALVLLQNECKRSGGCEECIECGIQKMCGGCPVLEGFEDVVIKKPRRFTDTDILWAKAAKASGATKVERGINPIIERAYAYTGNNKSVRGMVSFPASAFQSLETGESVPSDEILKEENENV